MRLAGKVAIVTGGAVGLGRATALLFAREGARVAILDVVEEEGRRVEAEVRREGGEALFLACDVTDEAQLGDAVATTLGRFGGLHVLVNNAGVNARGDATPATLALEEWDRVYEVNAKAPFVSSRAVIPHMKEQRSGSIVNVSSVGALYGSEGGHAYRSSKASLLSLTRTLAVELARDNVRVNCVCPGAMDTPMRRWAAQERPVMTPESIPLGRIADPVEVAYCLLFLASDEASYVTGATFVVDGGRSIV